MDVIAETITHAPGLDLDLGPCLHLDHLVPKVEIDAITAGRGLDQGPDLDLDRGVQVEIDTAVVVEESDQGPEVTLRLVIDWDTDVGGRA